MMSRYCDCSTSPVLRIGCLFFAVLWSLVALAKQPLQIGSDKQLFLGPWTEDGRDAHLVASMKHIAMTMNPARVTGERLMVVDKPWEKWPVTMLDMNQCVIKDGDLFRMYYPAMSKYPLLWKEEYCRILCYAESKDGLKWTKPNLGLVEWNGSRKNNILFPNDDYEFVFSEMQAPNVIIDPHASSPDEKYKMLVKQVPILGDKPHPGKQLGYGQYMFVSPDGIHWKLLSSQPMNPGAPDTQFSLFWDTSLEKYVAYTRIKYQIQKDMDLWRKFYGDEPRPNNLLVGRTTSADLQHWSKEEVAFAPDEMDQLGSPPLFHRMHFHGGNVSQYSEAPGAYIATPNAYYNWKYDMSRNVDVEQPNRHVRLPSTMDVQLLTSRDGLHWNRTPRRKPFIRLGPEGTFWNKTLWPDGNAIRMGDELWFFFAGLDVSHHEQIWLKSNGARGRAVLRLDGFISADAAYAGGELTTRTMTFAGDKLQLNVDTSAGGTVRVEIQDAAGQPIDGFAAVAADEINGNHIRRVVTWNGDSAVGRLAGKPVRLRFVMRDTKLYSFQFLPKS